MSIPFRVYYADGSTFDGDPFLAPALDVLVIVEPDPEHGRRFVAGRDYYVWEEERWWAADMAGVFSYLYRPGPKRVLIGRQVTDERYQQVFVNAKTDPDFGVKTAYREFEPQL